MARLLCSLLAATAALASPGKTSATVREVANFPLGAWLENLAVRANGQVLVTRVDVPEVWSVDPVSGSTALVARFTNATSAFGIAEVEPDVFAVSVGALGATGPTPGTSSIWRVDVRATPAEAHKVADVPQAGMINGIAVLHGAILAADSVLGVVYLVDLRTGESPVVLSGAAYSAPPPPAFFLGVNGVQVHPPSTLYFTNSGTKTLARVPLHADGTPAGPVETLAENLELPDDLTLAPDGAAYVTVNSGRSLVSISATGERTHIAGGSDSTQFGTPTAVQRGRTIFDQHTLYVTFGGIHNAATDGKVLAVDLAGPSPPSSSKDRSEL